MILGSDHSHDFHFAFLREPDRDPFDFEHSRVRLMITAGDKYNPKTCLGKSMMEILVSWVLGGLTNQLPDEGYWMNCWIRMMNRISGDSHL